MYYFCTKCNQVYRSSFEQMHATKSSGYNIRLCPKAECCGTVVEIDDFIMPAIENFNQKGYITEYCCSGHPYEDSPAPYVSFEKYYHFPINIPVSWYQDSNWGVLRAKPIKEGSTLAEKIAYISSVCSDLYEFTKNLDKISNL